MLRILHGRAALWKNLRNRRTGCGSRAPEVLGLTPHDASSCPSTRAQVDHLRLTSHAAGAGGQELTAADSELHTFLTRGIETSAAKLAERVASLPEDAELRRVLVFRSEDGD